MPGQQTFIATELMSRHTRRTSSSYQHHDSPHHGYDGAYGHDTYDLQYDAQYGQEGSASPVAGSSTSYRSAEALGLSFK